MQFLDISQYIPALYWTSKEHKRQYEFRLIAEAYIKQLSIEPLLILICIKNNFMNYCKVRPNKTDISNSWSVDNSYEFINKISDTNTARNIKTFDFSALYTDLILAKIFNFGKYVRLTVCYLPKFLWNFASMFVWRFVCLCVCLFVCPHGPCGHDTGRTISPIITKLHTNMDPWYGQKPIVFLGQRSNN